MKKILLAFGFLFFCASVVSAQTHYCDIVQPTTGAGVVGLPENVQACADGKDTNGNAITITGWTLYVNNTPSSITMTKGTTSPVSGRSVYSGTYTPTIAGNLTIQITSTGNAKESAKSTSFLLLVSLPPAAPSTPTALTAN